MGDSALHSEPPLASLSITHVYYTPSDPLSLASAYCAIIPQSLMIVYATLLYTTREVEVALALAGQLLCEGLNFLLKRLIREHRPPAMLGHGYGMPSSHAQFMAFLGVYVSLLIWVRGAGGPRLQTWRRVGYTAVALGGGAAVAGSRVYLGYHTARQVVVGCAVGAICGGVWFAATAWMRRTRLGESGVLARVTGGRRVWEFGMWLGGWAWIRDRCIGTDLVEEGWREAARSEAAKKSE
ncbi:hypothetical protein EDC01DRAFT_494164 [Geopyxis carbonaria]|nr:hypothetical protein EDC01DRAFT_494164 [Geopyxis carbonaria]